MEYEHHGSNERRGIVTGSLSESANTGEQVLKDIFRKDALNEMRGSLGVPVKPVGVSVTVLTIFLAAFLLVAGIFLATAKYARKETVSGQVTPSAGTFKISTQLSGVANQVYVKEGQIVKAGAALISISSDPVLGNGESLVESLKSIRLDQRRAQEQQTVARAEQLERQIEKLRRATACERTLPA